MKPTTPTPVPIPTPANPAPMAPTPPLPRAQTPALGCTLAVTLALTLAFTLTGCSLSPAYSRPHPPVPNHWPTTNTTTTNTNTPTQPAQPAQPAAPPHETEWQAFITHPDLRILVNTALTQNRTLRLAILDVERARALYGIRRADRLPAIDASASGSKQSVPSDVAFFAGRQAIEQYSVQLGVAAWEIDFFGRLKSLKDRALQEYLASNHARQGATLAVIASVAEAWLSLAADRESLALAQTTLEAQESAHALVRRRHELGLVPEVEVLRARAPLESARRDLALASQQVAQDRNALDLLVGQTVDPQYTPPALPHTSPFNPIQPGLSSEVLLLRPDVLQAEDLLRAAHADIGAARAAFFPRISLTAAVGTASSDLSGLFKSGSGAWSYAPQIVLPIFDARVWSAHKAARVGREIAVTRYEESIQQAFRDVADLLAAVSTVDDRLAAQNDLVRTLDATHQLAFSRFDKGIDSYLGVLDAQRTLFAAQQGLVLLKLEKLALQVRLYAALGGGTASPAR